MGKCLECNETLKGREGQKYCSEYCKSSYHYKKNKQKESSTYVKIDKNLKLNRSILKKYNISGQSQVKTELLVAEGFDLDILLILGRQKMEIYIIFVMNLVTVICKMVNTR